MSSSKEIGITVKKFDDFSEWYTQVVTKGELADYAAVKGFMVLRPYGFRIWERIREILDKRLKELGHENAYFPLLIPETFLRKEAEHFAGFTPEVFWVTHAGDTKLGERLAIRPTSETVIYDSYAKWVRSWRDLPLLINVWNSVLRAEITATKPFVRSAEFLWQEGHTVHATEDDADHEVLQILEVYRQLAEDYLAIPVITGRKTEREKFVGALYTTTLEAMMPDGKALQLGTSHNLGRNFSKAFEIRFLGQDEEMHLAWTTSWGVSWRLIGGMIMAHGDDRGLVLPPRVAPVQVVVIPIPYRDADSSEIHEAAKTAVKILTAGGLRVHFDDREQYTPGWKFHEWELKGIPLRLEIGPRDVQDKVVTLVRRDTGEKQSVPFTEVAGNVAKILEDIQNHLYNEAKSNVSRLTARVANFDEFKRVTQDQGGFVEAPWCGSTECEDKIKEETGATIRAVPFTDNRTDKGCVYCGQPSKTLVHFAKAY
jgi:prolyl-tRNA synthetase